MIGLFGRDRYSVLGIAAMLDLEKIPYRVLARPEDCKRTLLLVAAADLTADEVAIIMERPALVMNGGPAFARQVFGAVDPTVRTHPYALPLHESIWPRSAAECAQSVGKSALRLPPGPVCQTTRLLRGMTLAELVSSESDNCERYYPAVASTAGCVWSAIDLGAAFANLMTEHYGPQRPRPWLPATLSAALQRFASGAYYRAPEWTRNRIQRYCYARLDRRLAVQSDASEYPVDVTGWLLIELLKALIRRAAGWLIRVERWPAPFHSAATLTHDIEPTRYAYTTGLARLLAAVGGDSPALGLVAEASARHLDPAVLQRLREHAIVCHGLDHRGEIVHGRHRVAQRVAAARRHLERQLGCAVEGYRSPRLDRSPDLAWALDHAGFRYDSSYPDVDRENGEHFGTGVRLNVPYRPLLWDEDDTLRPSRCLELPLTAPDCIQPLFAGTSVSALRADVATKADFVRQTGGVYVALVHAGVFGPRDSEVRGAHLGFVSQQLRHPDTWLASIGQIADWWCRREALRLSVRDREIHLANEGPQPVGSIRVVIEHNGTERILPVALLQPGARVVLSMPLFRPAPVDALQYPKCA